MVDISDEDTVKGPEPITSLLRRELAIAASGAGKLTGALWEMNRALRTHLQPELDCDKMAINKGRSGAETSRVSDEAPLLPFPEFGSGSDKDYD